MGWWNSMANFDLAQYSTVADRIGLFAAEFPEFRIETSEFDIIRDGQNYIRVKVYIYKHKDDVHAWTSGISEERASKPFAIETAETSAFGRALANANYAAKLDSPRASREEMQRVNELNTVIHQITGVIEPWTATTPVLETNVVTLGQGVDIVQEQLGGAIIDPSPVCAHGRMVRKEGISPKNQKPYKGWTCSSKNRNDQCQAIWEN